MAGYQNVEGILSKNDWDYIAHFHSCDGLGDTCKMVIGEERGRKR